MTQGSEPTVLCEVNAAVATITLNRPKAFNAFNAQLRRELLKTVQDLEANAAVRVVVIRGNGPGFCAGADLGEGFPDPISEQIEAEYKPFLMAIAESRKIYIAQVHGTAAGIGAALAMSCDLMTMADTASIYMAFAAVALVPDGGNTWFLLRAMGYARALAAILEGTKIPASDCLTYGIANRLFAPDQLDAETVDWASKLAKGAPLAMAASKRLLRQVAGASLSEAITLEAQEQNALTVSQDCQRGIKAFRTRTRPVFKGD
ncbi:MAG: enoyl-CoA hydratase [Confluentimicrobium sp.]|jgi:2-(1,2-epoxy-1,2-dihydrophenyl)acetyl-CoA isomerase|uniref:enoyl-CoA hydratase/isomerase family protein n=1 Tax=Actibacterium sp. TaxID=1872125 RepID=UPI000C516E38|nr:enoyl-CoA hydratase-related protein [Actibacterium sp.]MBC56732.1 enoyl-CoA hydratase [Actibacterium sp.]|tara:strand:- start:13792 stop:14574 length:783 start_codon:yes stop_codon:yes gene_type:complete